MYTEIYMVRHAHSVFSLENEETRELSEKGWQDAGRITEILFDEEIDVIYSSSYVRALQTVAGLAKALHKEVILDSRFRERDLAARDHRFENPTEAMIHVFNHTTFKFPGGESNQEVQDRGIAGLKDIFNNHKGQKVAIGIHGNIMTCTMNYFDPKYNFEFWQKTTKPDIYRLTLNDMFKLVKCERLWKI